MAEKRKLHKACCQWVILIVQLLPYYVQKWQKHFIIPRNRVLQMQKLKSRLLRTQGCQILLSL